MKTQKKAKKRFSKQIREASGKDVLQRIVDAGERKALDQAMRGITQGIKETFTADEGSKARGCLFLQNPDGEAEVILIGHLPTDRQYEEVRSQCNKHKPIYAIYVVNGACMSIDANFITDQVRVDPEYAEKNQVAMRHLYHGSDLTVTSSIEHPVVARFHLRRCFYVYGASKNLRLALVTPYEFKSNDPRSLVFDKTEETESREVITNRGDIRPGQVWFNGVDWSDFPGD